MFFCIIVRPITVMSLATTPTITETPAVSQKSQVRNHLYLLTFTSTLTLIHGKNVLQLGYKYCEGVIVAVVTSLFFSEKKRLSRY